MRVGIASRLSPARPRHRRPASRLCPQVLKAMPVCGTTFIVRDVATPDLCAVSCQSSEKMKESRDQPKTDLPRHNASQDPNPHHRTGTPQDSIRNFPENRDDQIRIRGPLDQWRELLPKYQQKLPPSPEGQVLYRSSASFFWHNRASESIPLRFCGAPQNRKYAPSIDMRSPFRQGFKIEALLRRTRPYPHVGLHIT